MATTDLFPLSGFNYGRDNIVPLVCGGEVGAQVDGAAEVRVVGAMTKDLIALEDIEIATEHSVNPVVATLADITASIVQCYGVDPPVTHPEPFASA